MEESVPGESGDTTKVDYKFVLYLSKQCISSKNEDKNWYS